jgi:KTSC domain
MSTFYRYIQVQPIRVSLISTLKLGYIRMLTLNLPVRQYLRKLNCGAQVELLEVIESDIDKFYLKNEDLAKQFVTAWNLDNKDYNAPEGWEPGPAPVAHGADEFMPKARKGPYDDLIPRKRKGEYDDTPFGFTRGPAAAVPPGVKPATAADLPKPPVNAASSPSASSTLADPNAPKPDAKSEPEVVTVKYRGPVSLAPFKCDPITRSSFIDRVCYDAANSYMLIDLNGTWYHYCEIDAGTVSNLVAADSMGRFYNQSIKGRFDCRTHQVPHY